MIEISVAVKRFLDEQLWHQAGWSGTTYRWHPQGTAPPVMGLVFSNAAAGKAIFSRWVEMNDNEDILDELSVIIAQAQVDPARRGYTVSICPNPKPGSEPPSPDQIAQWEAAFGEAVRAGVKEGVAAASRAGLLQMGRPQGDAPALAADASLPEGVTLSDILERLSAEAGQKQAEQANSQAQQEAARDLVQLLGMAKVQWMDILPDNPPMLPRFKRELANHGEFLLAPVTRASDGKLWFNVELGIVKKTVQFLDLGDVLAALPDALPQGPEPGGPPVRPESG